MGWLRSFRGDGLFHVASSPPPHPQDVPGGASGTNERVVVVLSGSGAGTLTLTPFFRYNRMDEEPHENEALVDPLAQGVEAAVSLTYLSRIHKPMSRRFTDSSWCRTFLFARYGVAFM